MDIQDQMSQETREWYMRLVPLQKMSFELDEEQQEGADWEDGYNFMVRVARIQADEIERLRSLTAWQPIETAPRDGTEILLWDGGVIELCYWKTGHGWVVSWNDDLFRIREYEKEDASHWLPLPTPPEA